MSESPNTFGLKDWLAFSVPGSSGDLLYAAQRRTRNQDSFLKAYEDAQAAHMAPTTRTATLAGMPIGYWLGSRNLKANNRFADAAARGVRRLMESPNLESGSLRQLIGGDTLMRTPRRYVSAIIPALIASYAANAAVGGYNLRKRVKQADTQNHDRPGSILLSALAGHIPTSITSAVTAARLENLNTGIPTAARDRVLTALKDVARQKDVATLSPDQVTTHMGTLGSAMFKGPAYMHTTGKSRLKHSLRESLRNAGLGGSGGIIGGMDLTSAEALRSSPSILAHELGHASQAARKTLSYRLRNPAKVLGSIVGPAGVLLSKDEDQAKLWAGGASLSTLPMIYNELDASRRGSNILKQLKHPSVTKQMRRGAFIGVPTYAAAALSPWAMYLARKQLGGYTDSQPKVPTLRGL